MPNHPRAADLPALEPTAAELHALEVLPWRDTQELLEARIAAAALTPLYRAVVSPLRVRSLHTTAITEISGRAA